MPFSSPQMSIWHYKPGELDLELWQHEICPFCQTPLRSLSGTPSETRNPRQAKNEYWVSREQSDVSICDCCGWWKVSKSEDDLPVTSMLQQGGYRTLGAISTLVRLDLTDAKTPLDEIHQYLIARYDLRFKVDPRIFEQTVASVFRDLGYETEVTSFSNDGGIDVFLTKNQQRIGVQIKRYRETIKLAQLRELTGALVVEGVTKGIFVTTSTFSSGAQGYANKSASKGFPIELIDASRLLEALRVSQRPKYETFDEFLEDNPVGKLAVAKHDALW